MPCCMLDHRHNIKKEGYTTKTVEQQSDETIEVHD
jgi:hypothetical protein